MANQLLARLGIVLGVDSAELVTGLNAAKEKFTGFTREVQRQSNEAAKMTLALKMATESYGKSLTAVEKIELELQYGRLAGNKLSDIQLKALRDQAKAYDAVAEAAKKAQTAQKGGLRPDLQAALAYQTTDVITGLAGGQNPFMVLLQQGGQLRDQFGGLKPMFQGIAGAITVARVATVGLGGALAGLGYAVYKGVEEQKEFNRSLVLTGGYLNMTETQFTALSLTLSNKYNTSLSDTREAMQAVASSGRFTAESFGSVTTLIAKLASLTGESASAIATSLIPSLDGSATSAKRLNDQYHFLTVEQYTHIRQLYAQGKIQESVAYTTGLLNKKLNQQKEEVGLLGGAWREFWQGLKNRFKTPDLDQQLREADDIRIAMEKAASKYGTPLDKLRLKKAQERFDKLAAERDQKIKADAEAAKKAADNQAGIDYIASGRAAKDRQLRYQELDFMAATQAAKSIEAADKLSEIEAKRIKDRDAAISANKRANEDEEFAHKTRRAKTLTAQLDAIDAEAAKARREHEAQRAARARQLRNQELDFDDAARAAQATETLDKISAIEEKRLKDRAAAQRAMMRANEDDNYENNIQRARTLAAELRKIDAESARAKLDVYEKAREAYREQAQAQRDDVAREKERIDFYKEHLFLQGADLEIALTRRKTEQEIAAIYAKKDSARKADKDAAAEDLRAIQKLREANIANGAALKMLQDMNSAVFNNMSSALDNFVKTGKLNFKDFARSVIQDLIAISMKAQVMSMFKGLNIGSMLPTGVTASVASSMPGDALDNMMSLTGAFGTAARASGGSVMGGSTYLVGENGPELFTSDVSGTVVPNGQVGAAMSAPPGTVINGPYIANMNAIDTQSGVQFLAKNKQAVWAASQSAQRSLPASR